MTRSDRRHREFRARCIAALSYLDREPLPAAVLAELLCVRKYYAYRVLTRLHGAKLAEPVPDTWPVCWRGTLEL